MAGKMVKSWPWLALAGGGSWVPRRGFSDGENMFINKDDYWSEWDQISCGVGVDLRSIFDFFFWGLAPHPTVSPKPRGSWRPRRLHFLCFFDTSNDSDDATETSRQLNHHRAKLKSWGIIISLWWESQRIIIYRRKWYWPTTNKARIRCGFMIDLHDSKSLFRVALWTKCSTAIHSWLTRWLQDQWFWVWPYCLGDYWNGAKLILLRLQMSNSFQDFGDEDEDSAKKIWSKVDSPMMWMKWWKAPFTREESTPFESDLVKSHSPVDGIEGIKDAICHGKVAVTCTLKNYPMIALVPSWKRSNKLNFHPCHPALENRLTIAHSLKVWAAAALGVLLSVATPWRPWRSKLRTLIENL